MSQARHEQINEILKDLEDLKKRGFENMYALDENPLAGGQVFKLPAVNIFTVAYRQNKYHIAFYIKGRPVVSDSKSKLTC